MNINSIKKLSGNIISLALFYFVFLCSEYMFDNRMAVFTDSNGVVMAQSFVLGSSVPGFLSYYFIDRICDKKSFNKKIIPCISGGLSLICMIGIYLTGSYAGELLFGIILFIVLGYFGSLVHTQAALAVKHLDDGLNGITQLAGISYGIGILLQLVHNNLIADGVCQVIFLAVAMIIMTVSCAGRLCEVCGYTCSDVVSSVENTDTESAVSGYAPKKLGIFIILIVFVMTFVFATLDNAVTLVHAAGSVDIGKWSRIILAYSGIVAGFLYSTDDNRMMDFIMYIVLLLSTTCLIVISCGGPFMIGLIIFYLSAGFFSVYFASRFMIFACHTDKPSLWAGMGRAVNNTAAVVVAGVSLYIMRAPQYVTMIIGVLLFAVTSVIIFIYYEQQRKLNSADAHNTCKNPSSVYDNDPENVYRKKPAEDKAEITVHEAAKMRDDELFELFVQEFNLTQREGEVLAYLLHSDESMQEVAKQLAVSRAALYRHIANMNEKTQTKARMGLVQFYYSWTREKQ
ncbi:helix-turn-helix transcriptional regulator [Agathobacter sp.]|uniref:helix-turn-helix transcriptional regulator n=1 Tax=Agathobacter sp. TaxID=2021311 RepID=UPI003FD872B8